MNHNWEAIRREMEMVNEHESPLTFEGLVLRSIFAVVMVIPGFWEIFYHIKWPDATLLQIAILVISFFTFSCVLVTLARDGRNERMRTERHR
jgi:hypothetical protein